MLKCHIVEITCRGSNVNSPGAGACVVSCELTGWDVIVSVDDWCISVFVLDIICEDIKGVEDKEELLETLVLVAMVVCPVDSDELGKDVPEWYDIVVVVCEEDGSIDNVEDMIFECGPVDKDVGMVDDSSKFELEWDMNVDDTGEFEEVSVSGVDDDGDVVNSDVPVPVDMKEEVDVTTVAVELTDDDILEISVLVSTEDEELLLIEVLEGGGIDNKVVREGVIAECVCDKSCVVKLGLDDCVGIPVGDSDVLVGI